MRINIILFAMVICIFFDISAGLCFSELLIFFSLCFMSSKSCMLFVVTAFVELNPVWFFVKAVWSFLLAQDFFLMPIIANSTYVILASL